MGSAKAAGPKHLGCDVRWVGIRGACSGTPKNSAVHVVWRHLSAVGLSWWLRFRVVVMVVSFRLSASCGNALTHSIFKCYFISPRVTSIFGFFGRRSWHSTLSDSTYYSQAGYFVGYPFSATIFVKSSDDHPAKPLVLDEHCRLMFYSQLCSSNLQTNP
jgi:hypothetical protein